MEIYFTDGTVITRIQVLYMGSGLSNDNYVIYDTHDEEDKVRFFTAFEIKEIRLI